MSIVNYRRQIINTVLTLLIVFLISIVLPDKLRELLTYVFQYVFLHLVFKWYFIFFVFVFVGILALCHKWRIKLAIKILISLSISFALYASSIKIIGNIHSYKELRIAVAGFYEVEDDDRIRVSGQSRVYQSMLLNKLQTTPHKLGAFVRFSFHPLNEYNLFLYTHNSTTIRSRIQSHLKKFPIILWGLINKNGELIDFRIERNYSLFLPYRPDISGDLLRKTVLTLAHASNISLNDLIDYIALNFLSHFGACFTHGFKYFRTPFQAILCLEDSRKLSCQAHNILQKIKVQEIQDTINDLLCFNEASILSLKANLEERIGKKLTMFEKVLEINLYHPFISFEDVKEVLADRYIINLAPTVDLFDSLNFESEKRESTRKSLRKYASLLQLKSYISTETSNRPLVLDEFMEVIVQSDSFYQYVRLFEILEQVYPDNPLVYLYWGEAYKYHADPLNLDSNRRLKIKVVDIAIQKFKHSLSLAPDLYILNLKLWYCYFCKGLLDTANTCKYWQTSYNYLQNSGPWWELMQRKESREDIGIFPSNPTDRLPK